MSEVTPGAPTQAAVSPKIMALAAVSPKAMNPVTATPLTQDEKEELRKDIIRGCSKQGKKFPEIAPGIRKLNDTMIVKRDLTFSKDEFENQLKAWELLDPNVVRVPQPILCFGHKFPGNRYTSGFLVMEYVANGEVLEDLTGVQIDQVVDIIRYLATFKGTAPGGLMGGAFNGVLFESDPPPEPGSMQKLNEWINRRYNYWPDRSPWSNVIPEAPVDFGQCELVLCHLDIAPRNILWSADGGAPWLIDWSTAAYLPRFFEHLQHEIISGDIAFHEEIISKLEPLSEQEKMLKHIFSVARGNSL